MPNQNALCDHCVELARDVRRCASVLQANAHHHLMTAVIAAHQEGRSPRELMDMLSFLFECEELQPPVRVQDAEIVSVIPRAAVEAQVLFGQKGERRC